jgi:hypothetical protein
MEIMGNRKFVEIAGEKTHELPPLLVRASPQIKRLDKVVDIAANIMDSELMLPRVEASDFDMERRRMDLAIQLVEQYMNLVSHWHWGNGVLEWIRQCETTFETRLELRTLLRPDVWPHAGRTSFVALLRDKAVNMQGVELEMAVGYRLAFRQPPPIACCSDQFLFYLKSTVASSAYQTWSGMTPDPISALPPERFTFQVVEM